MSAIGGVFFATPRPGVRESLTSLLAVMPHRGDGPSAELQFPASALGIRCFPWEVDTALAGPPMVAQSGSVVVVGDASLYYRLDLIRRLASRGVPSRSEHPADLILAAYLAFGTDCVLHLEGDFAFVVLDGRNGQVVMGRDHVGRRPLHYAVRNGNLVVASTARSIATHELVRADLHLPAIAAAIAGLLGGSTETGFAGVHPVPAGSTCVWSPGAATVRVASEWRAPEFTIGGRANLAESGRQLRELLVSAVAERAMARTAVWLSGGADSTAVFAAAQLARQQRSRDLEVLPVTVSYPEGDQAREDHHVEAIAKQWAVPVTWIDSESIPLLKDAWFGASMRDDPYAHTFETVNRRLAKTSAAIGARVAFDGYGGDQLFHVSDVYLADLFARMHWGELKADLRKAGYRSVRSMLRHSVIPWLPDAVWNRIQRLRGKRPEELMAQKFPPWFTSAWTRHASLLGRAQLEPARRFLESPSAFESRWYTQTPYFPRAVSWSAAITLESGVEVRSPLMDRRIIEFAASRPLSERVAQGESKLVLREAVKDLVPESVLAPRPFKTGIPRGYLHRRLAVELAPCVDRVFAGDTSILAEMGVVDLRAYREALAGYAADHDHTTGVQLLLTYQCELWLRSVLGRSAEGAEIPPA